MLQKLWRFAAALPPIRFLSEQQSGQPANEKRNHQLRLQALRHASKQWPRIHAKAAALNDLAGHIHSLKDARKLVDLVAAEFSKSLPRELKTESIRNIIARAEFHSAANHGGLIPEQRVAAAWDYYLEKIGAPQEFQVTVDEVHALRDSYLVSSQLSWARGHQNIWTLYKIYATDADGKVANGTRALEVLNIFYMLYRDPELLQGAREMIKKGERLSDKYKDPLKPPAPGSIKTQVIARPAPPNPVKEAALQYAHDHGISALNSAVKQLLQEMFAG